MLNHAPIICHEAQKCYTSIIFMDLRGNNIYCIPMAIMHVIRPCDTDVHITYPMIHYTCFCYQVVFKDMLAVCVLSTKLFSCVC